MLLGAWQGSESTFWCPTGPMRSLKTPCVQVDMDIMRRLWGGSGWTVPRVIGGFIVDVAGGVLWIKASAVSGSYGAAAPLGSDVGLRIGFVLMIMGPIVGWLILPAITLKKLWIKIHGLTVGGLVLILVVAAAATSR